MVSPDCAFHSGMNVALTAFYSSRVGSYEALSSVSAARAGVATARTKKKILIMTRHS